ncbi:DUF1990 family protein [Plantactinospora endophytica]|uniref:DUF1990 domain-containing protein n=1 Tax=Plantactinospora endophytica TaxID=673535 RepID=A0ABQ4DWN9_9ACTN|nr:DUF1990 domain-containing protein [Plantactinospora endophytica]GIG86858.1 DUF1990 domain-containing protein [Plantactinospora endophytica]
MPGLTYAEVGATRTGALPAGYRHLRYRAALPSDGFTRAGEAVLSWQMHRAMGVRIEASAPRAEPGGTVTAGLGLGRLRLAAPCEVVWTVRDERRAGFGYGTLPGHPMRGEEAFLVEVADDGRVWFTVTAFSRPASPLTRLAGPLVPLFQRGYAWRCASVLRRLAAG